MGYVLTKPKSTDLSRI